MAGTEGGFERMKWKGNIGWMGKRGLKCWRGRVENAGEARVNEEKKSG